MPFHANEIFSTILISYIYYIVNFTTPVAVLMAYNYYIMVTRIKLDTNLPIKIVAEPQTFIQTRILLCMAARPFKRLRWNRSVEIHGVACVNRIYFREGNKCVHPFTDEQYPVGNMSHGIFIFYINKVVKVFLGQI